MDERAFLAGLARRLGRSAPVAPPPWQPPVLQPPDLPAPGDWEALAERFARELERVGGEARRCDGPAAARTAVRAIFAAAGVRRVIAWRDPFLLECGLLHLPEVEIILWDETRGEAELRRLAAECDAGLTGADAAVAETGSLLLTPGPGRGRMVGLLPWRHVAVFPVDRLMPSVPDLCRWLGAQATAGAFSGGPGMPSLAGINTGPSRSADIQSKLVLGAHGPGAVHAVLVG